MYSRQMNGQRRQVHVIGTRVAYGAVTREEFGGGGG
jgi:hypothetical protein